MCWSANVIIVSSLAQTTCRLVGNFHPTRWDWGTYLRPPSGMSCSCSSYSSPAAYAISIFEVRTLLPQAQGRRGGAKVRSIYGVDGEFDNPTALVNAARAAREKRAIAKLERLSPFPIEELWRRTHLHKNGCR